jgi:hypothetical protein
MKRVSAAVTMLALAGTIASGKSKDSGQPVMVYIHGRANMPAEALPIAEGVTCEIFAKAGVHIVWKTGQPKTEIPRQTIVLDITADAPASFFPGALGRAQEFEGVHITVFYDRVESMASREIVPKLLAHVLVHEITHVLEGIDRHSPEGIMKARWTPADIASMAFKPLPFDPNDVQLIHLGMARRSGVVVANANVRTEAAPLP